MRAAGLATLRSMKYVRFVSPVLAGLLLSAGVLLPASVHAGAQWKWRDASGAIQYSDRPPPAGTPEHAILARPTPGSSMTPVTPAPSASSAAPAANKATNELDAKRRKAEEEAQAKQKTEQKAEQEKVAKERADNCERARAYQRTLNEGTRIARVNAKGEREFLDDKARADEARRTKDAIAANCQ